MSSKWGRAVLALALVLSVVGAVAAQDVKYNALPDTDFTKFKTYKWVKIEGGTPMDQITDTQIKTAIDKQLGTKGLTKTDDEKADLYVGYQAAITQERQWNTYGSPAYGYGPRWGYGGGMGTATSSTINIGTVGIDVYDPAAKMLVWRGAASKTIDEDANPEKRQKNLDKAMAKLLKNYPPPVKKK
jgi:hypothetical protein